MVERKLKAYGLETVVPDDAELLADAYRAFHRSRELRKRFEKLEDEFEDEHSEIEVPKNLKEQVQAILSSHTDLRWDDAVQLALDQTQLDRVREEKQKARKKAGDFTDAGEDDDEPEEAR